MVNRPGVLWTGASSWPASPSSWPASPHPRPHLVTRIDISHHGSQEPSFQRPAGRAAGVRPPRPPRGGARAPPRGPRPQPLREGVQRPRARQADCRVSRKRVCEASPKLGSRGACSKVGQLGLVVLVSVFSGSLWIPDADQADARSAPATTSPSRGSTTRPTRPCPRTWTRRPCSRTPVPASSCPTSTRARCVCDLGEKPGLAAQKLTPFRRPWRGGPQGSHRGQGRHQDDAGHPGR
jgi:hypothetical protein